MTEEQKRAVGLDIQAIAYQLTLQNPNAPEIAMSAQSIIVNMCHALNLTDAQIEPVADAIEALIASAP